MYIDIHAHAFARPGPRNFCNPEQLLSRYDEIGVQAGVLLPLVNPEVYLPQSNEEILTIAEEHPKRFIPFCNIDPRALSNSPDAPLTDLLTHYRDLGCRGIGEVMPNLPFQNPLVQNLFRCAEKVDLPLTFDMSTDIGGTYGLYDHPGLPGLERSLESFPSLKFLGHGPPFWAEIAKLRKENDRSGYPGYPVEKEGVVPTLFRKYKNLYGDLSAGSGYNALSRDEDYAVNFLHEFQDRLLFGLDICSPDSGTPIIDLLENLRKDGRLGKKAFEKISHQNASRLLEL